jgi:hypothetical protein
MSETPGYQARYHEQLDRLREEGTMMYCDTPGCILPFGHIERSCQVETPDTPSTGQAKADARPWPYTGDRPDTPSTEARPDVSAHVEDKTGGGFHRGPLPDESLTYPCAECEQDWPCDTATLAKAARAVLDYDPKERWGGPHDWLAALIGYYEESDRG